MAEAKKVQRQAVKRSRCAIYTRKSSEEGLEELVFGMRCAVSVKYAVVKALEKRDRPVRLFELCEKTGSFLLQKRSLDTHELIVPLPMRCRALDGFFEDLTQNGLDVVSSTTEIVPGAAEDRR
jgi:hypothetical protein